MEAVGEIAEVEKGGDWYVMVAEGDIGAGGIVPGGGGGWGALSRELRRDITFVPHSTKRS